MQLLHAQKLESIGQLAAGIAHEINTPTQYIGDNLHFLQTAFKDMLQLLKYYGDLLQANRKGPVSESMIAAIDNAIRSYDMEYLMVEIPKAIEQSLGGVDRVAKIVRAMKEFSHPGAKEKTPTDLNHAIESTITVARNEWKYVADLKTDFDPALPLIPCLPDEFNQVILNLIINAAHALGMLSETAIRAREQSPFLLVVLTHMQRFAFRIPALGYLKSIETKSSTPFSPPRQWVKAQGRVWRSPGLLLWINMVETINFETEMGKGTTFVIRLPLNATKGVNAQARPL